MPVVRSGLLRAVAASLMLALVAYLASTVLLDAWYRSQEVETSGRARLPRVLYNAPETVATTEQRGPVGPVAAVFAGTRVLDGLGGDLDHPWIAVSSRTGDYRAISAPGLPPPTPAGVAVSPEGDLLAWAADGERLLVHAGRLRVIDVAADEQVATLGTVPARAVAQAVWRPDGTAVSLVDDRLVEIDVASGRRTPSQAAVSRTPSSAGPRREPSW